LNLNFEGALQAFGMFFAAAEGRYDVFSTVVGRFVPQKIADFLVLAELWWQPLVNGN
jgi:hypothetical protein